MDSLNKKDSYSTEFEELMEKSYVKDYTEAEAEEFLRVK